MKPASKSRSFRYRIEIFQLSRFLSGCYTFLVTIRFSSSDELKLRLASESFKPPKGKLSTFGLISSG